MVPPTVDRKQSSTNKVAKLATSPGFSDTQMKQMQEMFESLLVPIHQRLDAIEDALGLTTSSNATKTPDIETLNMLMGKFSDLKTKTSGCFGEMSSDFLLGEAMAEKQDRKKLKAALESLSYLFKGDIRPLGDFVMDSLACLSSEELATKSDQWWSSLSYKYKLDDISVVGDTLPIFGCYLDLYPRTRTSSKTSKLAQYGENLVHIYVPNDVVSRLKRQIQRLTGHVVSQGQEIVDDKQGLTSFRAFTAPDVVSLKIAMYKNKVDRNNGRIMETQRKDYALSRLYKSANSNPNGRILGGIAMLNAFASYSCAPNTFDSHAKLPPDIAVELKIELSGFHCLGLATDFVQRIT